MEVSISYNIKDDLRKKRIIEEKKSERFFKKYFHSYDVQDFSSSTMEKLINAPGSYIDKADNIHLVFRCDLDFLIETEDNLLLAISREIEYRKGLEKIEKEKQEKEKIEKEKFFSEMKCWIEKNGSEYLKKCLSLGIPCKRTYRMERYAPILDKIGNDIANPETRIDEDYEWQSRGNPSEYLLDALIFTQDNFPELEANIVYVTENNDYDIDGFEALHIRAEWANFGYLIW